MDKDPPNNEATWSISSVVVIGAVFRFSKVWHEARLSVNLSQSVFFTFREASIVVVWSVLMLNWRYLWSELDSSPLIFQFFISLDPELFVMVRSIMEL